MRVETNFAPLPRTEGLVELGAASAGVTGSQLEQYQRIASVVAARAVDEARREYVIPCAPENARAADRKCARTVLAAVGRLLYRQPLPFAILTLKRPLVSLKIAATT